MPTADTDPSSGSKPLTSGYDRHDTAAIQLPGTTDPTTEGTAVSPLAPPDQILRPAEVAAMLGVTRSTLTRWRQRDGFPQPLKLGPGAVGFRRSDVEAWLADRPQA